jgi:hypothetical protein
LNLFLGQPNNHLLGYLLAGDRVGVVDHSGTPGTDDDLLVLLNAGWKPST